MFSDDCGCDIAPLVHLDAPLCPPERGCALKVLLPRAWRLKSVPKTTLLCRLARHLLGRLLESYTVKPAGINRERLAQCRQPASAMQPVIAQIVSATAGSMLAFFQEACCGAGGDHVRTHPVGLCTRKPSLTCTSSSLSGTSRSGGCRNMCCSQHCRSLVSSIRKH